MDIGVSTKIIEGILIVELVLFLIILILTYGLKLWRDRINRSRQAKFRHIAQFFDKLSGNNESFTPNLFEKSWRKGRETFMAFFAADKAYSDNPGWQKNRATFLETTLLPMARNFSHSPLWLKRFFASETFSISADRDDEKAIIKLTKDKVPLVFYHSIPAAIKVESEVAINNIIDRFAEVNWIPQTLFLEMFKNAGPNIREFIVKRLQSTDKSAIRAACYKLLRQFPAADLPVEQKDLESDNFELRLAALKYLFEKDPKGAVPYLIMALKDPHWEVRLIAIHRLSSLKDESIIPALAGSLSDSDWWVRLSAAESLKSLGRKGENILHERSPELAQIPFDASKHISHTLW